MKKVIIHIGLQKTGTTFLQNAIFPFLSNTTLLGPPFTRANHAFTKLIYTDDLLFDKNEFIHLIEHIKKISNQSTLLISEEYFSGYPINLHCVNRTMIAYRLKEIFPNAEIIIFLRSQQELVKSLYNQWIKGYHSEFKSIDKFLSSPHQDYTYEAYLEAQKTGDYKSSTAGTGYFGRGSYLSLESFYYYDFIELYQRLFERVHVFLYEDLKQNPKELMKHLGLVLNQNLDSICKEKLGKTINSSLNEITLQKQILKNKLSHFTANKIIIKLLANSSITLGQLLPRKKDVEVAEYVQEKIRGYYRENNQKLAQCFPSIGIQKYPKEYDLY